jgi:hypothetical protein
MPTEENINFLDLTCVFKIAQDTTLERFGSTINSSVFDAANITGSLKQKGLIDFTPYYPGPNSMVLTEAGKQLKIDAEMKSSAPVDSLDEEILKQMSGGKRFPMELQTSMNVRSMDLAFRLYKLFKQNMLSYELKNGNVEIMLTEQGFLKAKTPMIAQAPAPQALPQGQAATAQGQEAPQQAGAPQVPGQPAAPGQAPPDAKLKKRGRERLIMEIVGVVVIIVVAFFFFKEYG